VSAQSGENEDAGSDDRADAERSQLKNSQRAFQAMRARLLRFVKQKLKRLFRKEVCHEVRLSR
jgi:protein subunit release factor A